MIPKVIHYCWFGHGEKSELIQKCMASWKKYLPEYRIVEWNEDNFDLNCVPYVKEAYEKRKWAFVTDYVRLYALYTQGGIYMDTDVEVLRPIDRFLHLPAFSGFQTVNCCVTGIMGAEKGSKWAKDMMDDYNDRHFIKPDGSLNLATNVHYVSERMMKMGMKLDGHLESIDGYVTFFPVDYFCPKLCVEGTVNLTENSYTIHHFAGSWLGEKGLWIRKIKKRHPLLGYYISYFSKDPKTLVRNIGRSLRRKWYRWTGRSDQIVDGIWIDEL